MQSSASVRTTIFCQTGSEAATGTQDGAEALGDALDGASKQLFIALQILDRADPKPVVHISEPEARRRLARDIAEALRAEGLAVEMRGGGTWDKLGPDETEADLTPFGRLVLELKIHKTQSISGLNQFVRLALKDAGSN